MAMLMIGGWGNGVVSVDNFIIIRLLIMLIMKDLGDMVMMLLVIQL